MSIDSEKTEFIVVKNEQGQFSIWPSYRAIPAGWQSQNIQGKKSDCLAYIQDHWVDMRPRSLRSALSDKA